MDLLPVERGQDMEEEIRCPCDLIGTRGEYATMIRQKPDDALPVYQLIYFNTNEDKST